jgi:hypothetical protein
MRRMRAKYAHSFFKLWGDTPKTLPSSEGPMKRTPNEGDKDPMEL